MGRIDHIFEGALFGAFIFTGTMLAILSIIPKVDVSAMALSLGSFVVAGVIAFSYIDGVVRKATSP